jgi:hypothetical protein
MRYTRAPIAPGRLQRELRSLLSGWLTFARTFFPVVLDAEPHAIVKSVVRAIWRDHAASKKDPWWASHAESFRDLERAYDDDGRYRRIVRFDDAVYESDKRKDIHLEPDHVVRRLLAIRSAVATVFFFLSNKTHPPWKVPQKGPHGFYRTLPKIFLGSIYFKHKRPQKNKIKMECVHCKASLDKGDIFEHFLGAYAGDARHAARAASAYGWSETDRVRFNRSVIVQPEDGPQFVRCPECKGRL